MGRSRARKPTREQKRQLAAAGLVVKNWLIIKETPEELTVVNKGSGRSRKIKKS